MNKYTIGLPVSWKTGPFTGDVRTGRIIALGDVQAAVEWGGTVVWVSYEELEVIA